jgi:hypothetical protein
MKALGKFTVSKTWLIDKDINCNSNSDPCDVKVHLPKVCSKVCEKFRVLRIPAVISLRHSHPHPHFQCLREAESLKAWRKLKQLGDIDDVRYSIIAIKFLVLIVFVGGRGSRRKNQATVENLQPGRAPVGLQPEETSSSNTNLAEFDSNSDFSDHLQEDIAGILSLPSSRSILQSSHPSLDNSPFPPPSPNLKPLLTSRADTPMLGAQARAAELAAASAAKQRQVSRELEERQLSPNSAVSLSAFTKPQNTTTRNKGNKTWKPLILDDIDEDDAAPDPTNSTPTKVDPLSVKEASDKKIPTAPRAMISGRAPSTVVAYAQPSKAQPSPVINMPQGFGPANHGGFPYPTFQTTYLPQPMLLGGMPHETYGSMMVPDDISPTKQEQKFSMLENIPFSHMMHPQEFSHFSMTQHGMMQPEDPFSHGTTEAFGHEQYTWDNIDQDAYYPEHHYRGQPQHIGYPGSDGTYTQRPNDTPGRIDFPADHRATLPTRQGSSQQASRDSPLRYKEPYDTEQAMKDCMNRLKEKAKDGKTVLHNPAAHKDPSFSQITRPDKSALNLTARDASSNQPPVPWEVRPKDTIRNANEWEVMPPPNDQSSDFTFANEIEGDNDLGNIKPAPGLPLPSSFGLPQLLLEAEDSSGAPPVGSTEWMRLAPITAGERDRVRRRMALAAKSLTNEVPTNNIAAGQDKEVLGQSQNWFHTDARGERLLRQQVDLSAQAHASKVIANIKARNGGKLPDQFQDGKDDGLAATLILGNVACNLQTYLVGDRKSIEQRRNFHKVKSVPDWCTDRGGLTVGGLGGGDSYFDGETGGFYGAPVRVARDPRFRPQVKEGTKVKPEEEWKHRHEMYGRRMM